MAQAKRGVEHSERTNMAMVHAKIGVRLQHDIWWGDLTVADHLLFYSRLRPWATTLSFSG
ncbi:hypothetical protein BGZ92_005540, partial [Podila epicladia]